MTMAQNLIYKQYIGNDVTKDWGYNYKIWEDSDIEVWLTENGIDTKITSNFSVADSGGIGGIVTYPVTGDPISSDIIITIKRKAPYTQEFFDIALNQAFNSELLEEAIDRTVGQIQQHDRDIALCVKVGETGSPTDYLAEVEAAAAGAAASAAAAAVSETNAETAETGAETAKTGAETAETNAETAQTAAEAAQTAAETAQTNAETAETNAETAETNAAASAAAAATSETNAETAETNAETAETNAAASAAAASTSETNAASSASDAEDSVNSLDSNYHEEVASGGEYYVDVSFTLATDLDNVACFIKGLRRPVSALTRTSDTRLTFSPAIPAQATFGAAFDIDENGNWGDGVLAGTLEGSTFIQGDACKFTNTLGDAIHWAGIDNADSPQLGAYRIIIRPQYSGTPTNIQIFISTNKLVAVESLLSIVHRTDGNLRISARDQGGSSYTTDLGVWAPTADTDYELEINYDFNTGATRLFVDGTQFGSTWTQTLTRDSAEITDLSSGDWAVTDQTPNFWLKQVIIFDAVQHTGNYTPDGEFPYVAQEADIIQVKSVAFSPTAVGEATAAAATAVSAANEVSKAVQEFIAGASQTIFVLTLFTIPQWETAPNVSVFVDGAKIPESDVTLLSATQVQLAAMTGGEEVEIIKVDNEAYTNLLSLPGNFNNLPEDTNLVSGIMPWYTNNGAAYKKMDLDQFYSSFNLAGNGDFVSIFGVSPAPQGYSVGGTSTVSTLYTDFPETIGGSPLIGPSVQQITLSTAGTSNYFQLNALQGHYTTPDRTYTVTVYLKRVSGGTALKVTNGGTPVSLSITDSWVKYKFQIEIGSTNWYVRFYTDNPTIVFKMAFLSINQGYIPQDYQPSIYDRVPRLTQFRLTNIDTPSSTYAYYRNLRMETGRATKGYTTYATWYTFGPVVFVEAFDQILTVVFSLELTAAQGPETHSLYLENVTASGFDGGFYLTIASSTPGDVVIHWTAIGRNH